MKGLPPTPAISQKFIFGKNSMLNPKKWFDNSNPEGNEKQKRPKTNENKPPRWRLQYSATTSSVKPIITVFIK